MALSDLNFASGFQGGLNSGMSLISQLDQRKRQAAADVRDEAEYQYKLNTLRPRDEKLASLQMRDLEGSIAHREDSRPLDLRGKLQQLRRGDQSYAHAESNQGYVERRRPVIDQQNDERFGLGMLQGKQGLQRGAQQMRHAESNQGYTESVLRPQQQQRHGLSMLQGKQGLQRGAQQMQVAQRNAGWEAEDRPLQQNMQRWQFNDMKNKASRQSAQERRTQQSHNLSLAQKQYQAALAAYESGDVQGATDLMIKADDLSEGLLGNFAAGVNGQMAAMSRDVATGRRALDDPEFTRVAGQFVSPSMKTSGRTGYRFDGVQQMSNDQLGYRLKPKMGGEHVSAISEASDRFGVDPDLIAAVIGQESAGDPNAQSNKGAFGLMQLMPATGKEVAARIGLKNFDPKNPQHNILVGTAYLKQQIDKYGNDPERVLAAYNAGPGAVDKYKGVPPFKETQGYIQKVMGNYRQLKQGVPATHGMSADGDDRIVAHTPDELTAIVQLGVQMERQFQQSTADALKQALLTRMAGMGSKPAKPDKQWASAGKGMLYNQVTGESKRVGYGTSGAAGGRDLPAEYAAFQDNPSGYISEQVSSRLNHLNPKQQMQITEQLMSDGASDLSAVDGVIRGYELERDAADIVDTLSRGVDQEMQGTELGRAWQAVASKAQTLGVDKVELLRIAKDSLEITGDENQDALLEMLTKKLLSVEQHQAARKKKQGRDAHWDGRISDAREAEGLPFDGYPTGTTAAMFGHN